MTKDWRQIRDRLAAPLGGSWQWDGFGPDGISGTDRTSCRSVLVTRADHEDGADWLHASVARRDRLPTYHDLTALKAAVWGDGGWAYQVFPSRDRHVSIHSYALHLWGRADGKNVLPDFGEHGTI